jgi:hypothetical protein
MMIDPMNFALRLKLRKLDDTGLFALILLHELLLKQGWANLELVQGYLTVMGETCWHVWIVQNKKTIIDLGRIIATLKDSEFEKCKFDYSIEKPQFEIKLDQKNVDIWESRSDRNFWKTAPKNFLEFRSRCHKLV